MFGKRHQRTLLRGLAVAALLFLSLELALWGLGIGGLNRRARTESGHERDASYLVPTAKIAGGWSTRFGSPRFREVFVPPKGTMERIIVFGSSTARRFGVYELAKQFDEWRGDDDSHEVFNLGVPGYGSWRVSAIFEQALQHLDPDLAILYFGDNEFSEVAPEDRGEQDLEGSSPIARVVRWSRTFNALRQLLHPGDVLDERRPAEFLFLDRARARNLTFEDTLERADRLRENLQRMCRLAREREVKLVLCTLAYNRLTPPSSSRPPADTPQAAMLEIEDHLREARAKLTSLLNVLLPEAETVMVQDWSANLRRMGDPLPDTPIWRPECVEPLASQPPYEDTEPWQWDEKVWTLLGTLERFYRRDVTPDELADLAKVERSLQAVLELCPDHPFAHYELGLVQYLLGRDRAVSIEHLELAASYDRAPRKSSERINDLIREVAREFPEVLLYDADAYLRSLVVGGLVGWECMVDHCHPGPGSYVVVRADLVRAVVERWN